jgi:murein DD-endopeptidase MepM/ murein hydrolase activator NlpD
MFMAAIFQVALAQVTDPDAAWPLCGRITENPPPDWQETDGCPATRFGNPAFSDAPFSSTFGPRPLGSQSDRFDFHRGVDIATPTGTPIFAISDGVVKISGVHSGYSDPLLKLRHYRPGSTSCNSGGGCYHSYYLHISNWLVAVDEEVQKGALIGYTGASGASGFQHLHFEVRDAPAFDPYSAWQKDAIHPFGVLPYSAPNNTVITFGAVDNTDPSSVQAEVLVTSNRYDLVSVEMSVFDDQGAEVPQAGNTPDTNGYHVLPPFYDMNAWNFEYTHKDSSGFPWEDFGAGGPLECPFHADHGASYDANVHMDAQVPGNPFEGLFNGARIVTAKYWLIGDKSYWLNLEFLALQGPADCIEATAVFASGDTTTQEWGSCGEPPPDNELPVADFEHDCFEMTCSFDGSPSFDMDGEIVAWDWDFGDGGQLEGEQVEYVFEDQGDYEVGLTVTDDRGGSAMTLLTVSPWMSIALPGTPPEPDILLELSTNRKSNKVRLAWSGANGKKVDIYRDGARLARTRNDGAWSDRNAGSGVSRAYRVCEQNSTSECSATLSFSL